jgi:hypothetical protein
MRYNIKDPMEKELCMRKIYPLFVLVSLFLSQSVFADMDDSKPCKNVAQACRAAGFDKSNHFWKNCMKPLLLGQTVKGVTIDPKIIAACRTDKINKMKKEMNDLENVK